MKKIIEILGLFESAVAKKDSALITTLNDEYEEVLNIFCDNYPMEFIDICQSVDNEQKWIDFKNYFKGALEYQKELSSFENEIIKQNTKNSLINTAVYSFTDEQEGAQIINPYLSSNGVDSVEPYEYYKEGKETYITWLQKIQAVYYAHKKEFKQLQINNINFIELNNEDNVFYDIDTLSSNNKIKLEKEQELLLDNDKLYFDFENVYVLMHAHKVPFLYKITEETAITILEDNYFFRFVNMIKIKTAVTKKNEVSQKIIQQKMHYQYIHLQDIIYNWETYNLNDRAISFDHEFYNDGSFDDALSTLFSEIYTKGGDGSYAIDIEMEDYLNEIYLEMISFIKNG